MVISVRQTAKKVQVHVNYNNILELVYLLRSVRFLDGKDTLSEKSLFQLVPDFVSKSKVTTESDVSESDCIYKFGNLRKDFENDALELAWNKCDLFEDK